MSIRNVGENRNLALNRLLLAFTGYQHAILGDLSDTMAVTLKRVYKTSVDAVKASEALRADWNAYITQWEDKLHEARAEAVKLSFGEWAVQHNHYIGSAVGERVEESAPAFPPVFEKQLQEILDAASARIYDDGFNLSKRIWRHDSQSWAGIKRVLYTGIQAQQSAWQIAEEIEQYLAPLQNCPRWTATRLYGLTKADIASGNRSGLLSGADCQPERGVAYNALRLARTEISYASAAATKRIYEKSPWVLGAKYNLSPAHPKPDICDEYAAGGDNGNGVYAVSDAPQVPAHPHCLCFYTSVQMSDDDFRRKMRGWLNGTEKWQGMDEYAKTIDRNRFDITNLGLMTGVGDTLHRWLFEVADAIQPYLPGLEG